MASRLCGESATPGHTPWLAWLLSRVLADGDCRSWRKRQKELAFFSSCHSGCHKTQLIPVPWKKTWTRKHRGGIWKSWSNCWRWVTQDCFLEYLCNSLLKQMGEHVISFQKDHPLKSWHFTKVLLSRFLSNCACVAWGCGGGQVGSNRINRKFLRLWLVKDRMKNKSRDFQLLIQNRSLWNRWPQLSQDKTPDPLVSQSGQIQPASPCLTCFWIPQPAHTFRHFPVLALNRRGPCRRTGAFLHGNTESACYSKDRGQRTGHLCVNTGSSPRAGEVQDLSHLLPNFPIPSWPSASTASQRLPFYLQNLRT